LSDEKFCSKCNTIKPLTEFNPRRSRNNSFCCWCKSCQSIIAKERYLLKKEHISSLNRQWKQNNKEYSSVKNKEYKLKNKEIISQKSKESYLANKEKFNLKSKLNYYQNKESRSIQINQWKQNNPDKVKQFRLTSYKRSMSTPSGRLNNSMTSGINRSLRGNKQGRHWETLVGYTVNQLKSHIENQFTSDMSWDNYGSYWEIDHKIPKSLFKYQSTNEEEFKKCWSLDNLRPLNKSINRRKYNKLNYEPMCVSL
jgi:hypothetical protein